jgi:hypothetical protein
MSGFAACEYAEKGFAADENIELYLQNNRFYFITLGYPTKAGNLKQGFEFQLSKSHKTTGKYSGKQTDSVNDTVIVLGFAEVGKIIITDVFSGDDTYEEWVKNNNIKLKSQE